MLVRASHPIDEFKSDSILQPHPESITRVGRELPVKQKQPEAANDQNM